MLQLLSIYKGAKRWSDVARVARRVLVREPDHEEATRFLLTALLSSGRVTEAREGDRAYSKLTGGGRGPSELMRAVLSEVRRGRAADPGGGPALKPAQ